MRKQRANILSLPAEIRNRIYDFASEEPKIISTEYGDFLPLIIHRKSGPGRKHIGCSTTSTFNFIGLTQACKQLRTEFYSIWKRSFSARIWYNDFECFVQTFHAGDQDRSDPKLLQITWPHCVSYISIGKKDTTIRLLPFLKFQMTHPCSEIQFRIDPDAAWPTRRFPTLNVDGDRNESYQAESERSPHSWTGDYLDGINRVLLKHNNRIWEDDIRRGFITEVNVQNAVICETMVDLRFDWNCNHSDSEEGPGLFYDLDRGIKYGLKIWNDYQDAIGFGDRQLYARFHVGHPDLKYDVHSRTLVRVK